MNRIAFVGDIAFVGKYDLATNKNAKDLFKSISDYLSTFDYVVGNLEGPLTDKQHTFICKSMHLKMNPLNIELLKQLHINAVCLSNNHIFDYGQKAVNDTIRVLDENGIEWFGLNNKTLIKNFNSKKISLSGFCCYSTNGYNYNKGLTPITYENVEKQIKIDKSNNCISFISFHWGEEYTYYPKTNDIELINSLSEKYDFNIIGHHPHIIQGIVKQHNSNICYSLGNFCFDDLTSINKKMFLKQEEYNKIGQIIEFEINDKISTNRRLVDFNQNELQIIDNKDLTDSIDSIPNEYNDLNYSKKMKNQVQKNRSVKFKKKDIKWILSKMNYYSIGAFILSKLNRKKYRKFSMKFKKNNIIYVGNFDIINLNAAGKRVLNNSKLLVKLGYRVILIGLTKSKETIDYPIEIGQNILLFNLSYPENIIKWLNYKKTYKNVIKIIKDYNLENKIKYMIFYGSSSLTIFINKMLNYNKQKGIISIADVVDWLNINIKNPIINCFKSIDYTYQKTIVNKKMKGIIVISDFLCNYYKNNKTVLIPPLVPFNDSKITYRKDSDKINFIYAGNPFRNRRNNITGKDLKDRIDIIIEIFSNIKFDYNLDFYGITKEELLRALPEYESKLNTKKINFMGKVNNDIISERLCNYDFSILLRDFSRESNAGFSTKLVESISAYVPVITNNTSDIKKYIKEGKNGFIIDINNIKEATSKITEIIFNDKENINKMKEYCKENQIFDYNNYLEVFKHFLDELD